MYSNLLKATDYRLLVHPTQVYIKVRFQIILIFWKNLRLTIYIVLSAIRVK